MSLTDSPDLYSYISGNIEKLNHSISAACEKSRRSIPDVRVVAVTKNISADAVRAAYESGLRDFGENRVHEGADKFKELHDIRSGVTLHLIGHLQGNKVKSALENFDVIQSVDSIKLAQSINEHASKPVPIFIEVNAVGEVTKYGFGEEQVQNAVKSMAGLRNLQVLGLMTVAPWVSDPEEVRPVFKKLRQLNSELGFKELSMGMTDDFEVAIEEGATMVRIGRAIFGERR